MRVSKAGRQPKLRHTHTHTDIHACILNSKVNDNIGES